METQTRHPAYQAALDADAALHDALAAHYGRRAGDMRYKTADWPVAIRSLGLAKQRADEAWLKVMRSC